MVLGAATLLTAPSRAAYTPEEALQATVDPVMIRDPALDRNVLPKPSTFA
jgi:hypothetical protein